MRRIEFDPELLSPEGRAWWAAWIQRAAAAKSNLEATYGPGDEPRFNSRIWKDLKEWFFEHVFAGKCAYCEAETDPVTVGHGEHWRPKGAVSDIDGVSVLDEAGDPHPGYYWLAYDWQNLLPACEFCNTGRGKGTRFPVRRRHVFAPDGGRIVADLDEIEEPLLLHPFGSDDPAAHIGFDELGVPVALTDRGDASIRVFDLGRDTLNRARQKRHRRMKGVATLVLMSWVERSEHDPAPAVDDLINERLDPADDYSLARRIYIKGHVLSRLEALQQTT